MHQMLEHEVIELATVEWDALIVLPQNKSDTYRFCVDYKSLNALAQKASYPMPRMDEGIDSFGEPTVFYT